MNYDGVEGGEKVEEVGGMRFLNMFSQPSQLFSTLFNLSFLKIRVIASPTASRRPGKHFLLTGSGHEERQYHRHQCRALDESGSQDHVSADVAHGFGLPGNGFYGFTTDRSHADTGADSGQTCSNCCVHNFEFDDFIM